MGVPPHPGAEESRFIPHVADFEWTGFTGRPWPSIPCEAFGDLAGKSILITGAGGSIGSALAKTLVTFPLRRLLLFDHAEGGLAALQRRSAAERVTSTAEYILGDVCDRLLVRNIFRQHKVDAVFHAAACKHVPLLERNLFTAASVNIFGTRTMLEEACDAEVDHFVLLSTDKAADPISVLGATKRVAELVTLLPQGNGTSNKVLRLCNVLGSAGSVAVVFAEQMKRGEPMTVTHPDAERFFISPEEAVAYLLRVLTLRQRDSLWIPNLSTPQTVESLARFQAGINAANTGITYSGLRPGDKLRESLWSAEESPIDVGAGALIRLQTYLPAQGELDSALSHMLDAISERNIPRLIGTLQSVVPTYHPSEMVLSGSGMVRE